MDKPQQEGEPVIRQPVILEEEEIDLLDYVEVMVRHRWLIFCCVHEIVIGPWWGQPKIDEHQKRVADSTWNRFRPHGLRLLQLDL